MERIPRDDFRPLHAVAMARSSSLLILPVHLLPFGPGPHSTSAHDFYNLRGSVTQPSFISCGGRSLRCLLSRFTEYSIYLVIDPTSRRFETAYTIYESLRITMLADWFGQRSQGQDRWFRLGFKIGGEDASHSAVGRLGAKSRRASW